MNTKIKYLAIGSALLLGATAFSVFGAESVYTLIANGKAVIARLEQANAKHETLKQKSKALAATAESINKAQPALNQAVQRHNRASQQLQAEMAAYKKNCQSNSLSTAELDKCKRQQKRLNARIQQINAGTKSLRARQEALKQKIAGYNAQSKALNEAIPTNTDAISKAFAAEQDWLDKARKLVASPQFAPYRKEAGCPEVVNPPTTAKGLRRMAHELLGCLENLAHAKSKHGGRTSGGRTGL